MAVTTRSIMLAGGCSSSLRSLLLTHAGVIDARMGFANSACEHPRPHAETVDVGFNLERISLRGLLEYFFQIHDPTTLNRQGDDVGEIYRSAVFYRDEDQRQAALQTIADIDASGLWPGVVMTEVTPYCVFWETLAEPDELAGARAARPSCHFVRPDWKLPEPYRAR